MGRGDEDRPFLGNVSYMLSSLEAVYPQVFLVLPHHIDSQ